MVARVELSTDALLGIDRGLWNILAAMSRTFWRVALAHRELVFGRCRRTGAQISGALGHAMSLFGLRRELYSVFQHACQFVNHFEGRVGHVWASVRWEFRISWSLLPFPKGDLSRPWDITVHAADESLSGMGVAVLTVVKSVG